MLIYMGSRKSVKQLTDWFKCFLSYKDVIFRWSDPIPFVMQLIFIIDILSASRKKNISIQEAMTHDIEWNGD